jgi:hypothetical protein
MVQEVDVPVGPSRPDQPRIVSIANRSWLSSGSNPAEAGRSTTRFVPVTNS